MCCYQFEALFQNKNNKTFMKKIYRFYGFYNANCELIKTKKPQRVSKYFM